MHQSNHAVELIRNYERTGIIEDLNKAISIIEQVIDMTPQGSIHLAGMLSNFGAMLGMRFERTGSMGDLNRAVDVADMAVNATSQDHPDRAAMLATSTAQLRSLIDPVRSNRLPSIALKLLNMPARWIDSCGVISITCSIVVIALFKSSIMPVRS